jgi:predicted transcriptional regulator
MSGKLWIPTEEILTQVHDLIKQGVTETNVARVLGLHPSTFSAKKNEFPELDEAIKKAKAYGEKVAASVIWEIMNDPNHKQRLTAAIFYLKTQHRWSEKDESSLEPVSEIKLKSAK